MSPKVGKFSEQDWGISDERQHQHQLRLWHSFHRHTVLSMCALALLAVATARPPGTPAPRAAAGPATATVPQAWVSPPSVERSS